MAYAGICGTSDNLSNHSIAYFHTISYDEIVNYSNFSTGNTCPVTTTTGNHAPVVTPFTSILIPKSTPFFLTGSASDIDGDTLTYSWEEYDAGTSQNSWNAGFAPYFRSYVPSKTGFIRYCPSPAVVNSGNYTGTRGEYLPTTAQTLKFRLTARDNKMGGGGVCYASGNVVIDASGPFQITYPTSVNIVWSSSTKTIVTWDVNGTDQAPVSCDSVQILISLNSGSTYSVLLGSTPNDGTELISVPSVSTTINTCRVKIMSKGNSFYTVSKNNFTIDTTHINTTGIKSLTSSGKLALNISPNPFSNQINLSAANLSGSFPTILQGYNNLGEIIFEKKYTAKNYLNETIDMSSFSPGIYFFKISNASNIEVKKTIKE